MEELRTRFDSFINKLTQRANEIADEVKDSVQTIYDEDTDQYKRSFHNFKMGIQGQFKALITKAQDVFDKQIKPYDPRYSFSITDPRWDEQNKWYTPIHDGFEQWKDQIRTLSENIFAYLKEKSAEETLQEIIEEYHNTKNNFHCSQCGGKLEINEIYFISTYIHCPYCQTQNTFVPSSKMRELEFIAKDVALERTQKEEKRYQKINDSHNSYEETYIAYFRWRAAIWKITAELVPILSEANKKVFFREMNDWQMYEDYNFEKHPDLYRNIIKLLHFQSEYEPKIKETTDEAYRQKLIDAWKFHLSLAIELLEQIGSAGLSAEEFDKLLSEMRLCLEKIDS